MKRTKADEYILIPANIRTASLFSSKDVNRKLT